MTDISDEDYQKNRAKLIEDGKAVTGRISDACRLVGFGLLAVFYGIKTDEGAFATSIKSGHGCLFMTIGALGVLAIVLDYLQYMFANWSIEDAKKRPDQLYGEKTFSRLARTVCFYAKQLVILAGSISLVWLVVAS
ncbi:hypothetical protein ACYG9Z_24140 [Mesorhizobium sp. RSR380A]|uniref:hypothetical protein n=1 Tax=unclassified Mesorhizobium TaxID=325217 RepID=UPI0003CDFB15|nr:hypothetical protein [Mesorhizobium sp. LNJC380A00]ESY40083.1 hypothetical protein X746_27300 [Mesorhizobium sp. LNJC380A00]